MHNWITFGTWISHNHTWTHKTHHGSNLGEATTFLFIVFSMINDEGAPQMSFCPKTPKLGVLKFLKLRFLAIWRFVTSCANLWLRWCLKKSYNLHQELSNDMWPATYTQVNQSDSRLLVVRNQISTLTPGFSFGHNLCFKFSNGSCKLILNIYNSRYFQWYKELFNPMNFDLWNHSLNIENILGIPTPKVGVHLGVCGFIPSHFFTPGLHSQSTLFHALALVTSPKLRLLHVSIV
jgi:hypothetical protein